MIVIQVTVEYKDDKGACVPIRVDTVLISAQHTKDVSQEVIYSDLKKVIEVMFP